MTTAHRDTFARDNLPPPELLPELVFRLPELAFPDALNCAAELLDRRGTAARIPAGVAGAGCAGMRL